MTGVPPESPVELVAADSWLDDRDALERSFESNGYLFFRSVLDPGAVAEAKDRVVSILAGQGILEVGAGEPRWTGVPVESQHAFRLAALHDGHIWQMLVQHPQVAALFEQVFGEPVVFLPVASFQVKVPVADPADDPFEGRHQDGFFTRGIDFRTCWMPLREIDETLGGLAVAPGFHSCGWLEQPADDGFAIPPGTIPDDAWRRAAYQPGDLLVFDHRLPHCGLPNRSASGVRLSIDVRAHGANARHPVVGEVVSVSDSKLRLRTTDAAVVELRLDRDSFLQRNSRCVSPHDFRRGELLIVSASSDGVVVGARPPTAASDLWW